MPQDRPANISDTPCTRMSHQSASRLRHTPCALMFIRTTGPQASSRMNSESMPSGTRWQHAIHHVHPHFRVLFNLVGIAHAHHIARLVPGQPLQRPRNHLPCHLARLADGQDLQSHTPADPSPPVAPLTLFPQIGIHPTLHDPEQALRLSSERSSNHGTRSLFASK